MRGSVRAHAIERLERLAAFDVELDEFRFEAIEVLRQAIGFTMWGFPLVDPDTLIPYRPLVSDPPPWGAHLPERWILDQSTSEVNDRRLLARGREHVGVLSASTEGDLARCRRWRDLGQPIGMGDELRAAIVDVQGCWGSFELFRASDEGSFDDDDADLMRIAVRVLAGALREGSVRGIGGSQLAPRDSGVLVIGPDLRARGVTASAHDWFKLMGAPARGEPTQFPIVAYGTVGRLLAAEAGEDVDRSPRVRVRLTSGQWAAVEAARLDAGDSFAVTIRAALPREVLDLLSRAHSLTVRERQLAELVMAGLDTRQIASRLFISDYTAKDHLKSVLVKMGLHSRRELLGNLLDTHV